MLRIEKSEHYNQSTEGKSLSREHHDSRLINRKLNRQRLIKLFYTGFQRTTSWKWTMENRTVTLM